LNFDGSFVLFLILFLDADSELPVTLNNILLIDSDSHLIGGGIIYCPLSFGIFVGEDNFTVEAVLVWNDFICLAFVQSELRLAFCSFLSGPQLFLRFIRLGLRFLFEHIISKQLAC